MTTLESYPHAPSSDPKLTRGIFFSLLFHILLVAVLVGVPDISPSKKTYFSSTYMVNLVEEPRKTPGKLGGSGSKGSAVKTEIVKETAPKKPSKVTPKKKESATLTIKEKPKKSSPVTGLKKKQQVKDTEGAFSLALDKIKKKVEENRRREEIAEIRERITEEESGKEGVEEGVSASGTGEVPLGVATSSHLPLNYRLYYQAIEQKIKSNWNLALPKGVIEDMRGMEVVLSITIRADGEITDVSFEKKTGNVYLDDSAYRAIKKSNPLPPFAQYNIRESSFETGIVFPAGELL